MQHFWYEANLDHKDTQCAVLGDVQSPALHIFNNLLCFQLWVHVGLRELSPRIVEFDSDCLKASLHSEESSRLQFQAKNFHISKFPHTRITKSRAGPSICFAVLKKTVPQVGSRQAFASVWFMVPSSGDG